jgi:hypothetical protein
MADALTRAYEISRPAVERLADGRAGRVLSVFAHACNLLLEDEDVVTLISRGDDIGPFHVALGPDLVFERSLEVGAPARCERDRVRVGGLLVDWSGAALFEPRPEWNALHARFAVQPQPSIESLRGLVLRHARPATLLDLLGGPRMERPHGPPSWEALLASARRAAEALRIAAHSDDLVAVASAARRLAGLGPGSTPAGDDFLVGLMLRRHLSDPHPEAFCSTLLGAAAPLTSPVSAAFLRAAAAGECSRAWHRLLAMVMTPAHPDLEAAMLALLSQGGTSGADALAGWLWL